MRGIVGILLLGVVSPALAAVSVHQLTTPTPPALIADMAAQDKPPEPEPDWARGTVAIISAIGTSLIGVLLTWSAIARRMDETQRSAHEAQRMASRAHDRISNLNNDERIGE